MRLFNNGQWETVLVDDHFPVLPDDLSLPVPASQGPTRGAAAAHSPHMGEIWVALVEKVKIK